MRGRLRRFYEDNLPIGDRLGESIYAVWMGVVSIGLINAETTITPDYVHTVIGIAFGVNLIWGILDGVTVMFTNIIERRRRNVVVHRLRSLPHDADVRSAGRAALDGTIAASLSDPDKDRVLEMIAAAPAGDDPALGPARPSRQDWGYVLAIILIDVLHVVPLVLPLILIDDIDRAIFVSRIIAATTFAALGAAYARNLGRSPVLAAVLLGAFGYTLFTIAYEAGW